MIVEDKAFPIKEILQIVILLLGVLSALFPLIKKYLEVREKSVEPQTSTVELKHPKAPELTPAPRSLFDLSFVLICSGLYSLLLADSLVISGRTPSPGSIEILKVLFITLVVVVTMVWAWLRGRSESVTGFLAITTLIVLIISPGGPLSDSRSADEEVGISLWVPVISLMILACSMLIYKFGSPLGGSGTKQNRMIITAIVIVLSVISSAALGKQYVTDVVSDERVPKFRTAEAKNLVEDVKTWDLPDHRLFYRLASETMLASV